MYGSTAYNQPNYQTIAPVIQEQDPQESKGDLKTEVHFIGQIIGGKGFPSDDGLFCEMMLQIGENWELLSPNKLYQTQTCYCDLDKMFIWGHPIDLFFAANDLAGWPKGIFRIWRLDSSNKMDTFAYGVLNFPRTSGFHVLECETWSPVGDWKTSSLSFFLGTNPRLQNVDLISQNLDRREYLSTASSGKIIIELEMHQQYDKFWVFNQEKALMEKVVLKLKCRVLSHYHQDPQLESMLIIDNHQVIINDYQHENYPESWRFKYGLAVTKEGVTINEYRHHDLDILLNWKEKIIACSKIGSFFSNYRKVEEICKTNSSCVIKVQKLNDLKIYAAKIYNLRRTRSNMSYIVNEVKNMKRLDHYGLVQLYEVYKEKDSIILIMEYCNGGNLRDKIFKSKHYNEDKAAKLMKNLLEILEYLHEQNIIHKDIKPDNIILCHDNDDTVIKLVDFELACNKYSPLVNKFCGTPGYLTPEIFKEKHVSHKSDMYACGLVLYYMLTGKHAFGGMDIDSKIEENYNGNIVYEFSLWKNISENCKTFIKSLLSKNPKDRPTSSEALKSAWIKKYSHKTSPITDKNSKEHQIPEINLFSSIIFDTKELPERKTTPSFKRINIFFKDESSTCDVDENIYQHDNSSYLRQKLHFKNTLTKVKKNSFILFN